MRRHLSLFVLLLFVFPLLLTGCATSLTNSSPAKTYDAGKGQAALGIETGIHTQAFRGTFDAARASVQAATEEDQQLDTEVARTILDAVLLWQLFPYSTSPEVQGRIGLYDGLLEGIDAGFRYNGALWKADLRLQLWESPDAIQALSIQAGYAKHSNIFGGILETVDLAEFSRHDIDILLSYGAEIDHWARFYVAPRYLYSNVSTVIQISDELLERFPDEVQQYEPGQYFQPEGIHYAGLNLGTMLGYRWVFLALELTVMRIWFRPEVLGSQRNYDGWVVAPNAGLVINW